MTFHDQIADFFREYVDAFTKHDADALSQLWDSVGLFPSPTGNFVLERPAFRDHCVSLMEFYRAQGVTKPEGELLSATELYPNVAQARLAYRMVGREGETVACWDHVYILRRSDRWRVSLTIADGELAEWSGRGATL